MFHRSLLSRGWYELLRLPVMLTAIVAYGVRFTGR